MAFKLRFVQRFKQYNRKQFLELERLFINLEEMQNDFPKAKRYIPVTGKEPANTMIWEAEFDSLEAACKALHIIESNTTHEELLGKQSEYMLDSYTEIYQQFV
jgi:hypothetical protein